MKVTSNWTMGKVFWRTFGIGDTVYLTGRWEGFVSTGESFEVPDDTFKMELKRGDIFGSFIIRPGRIFNGGEELILTDQGELVVPVAPVDPDTLAIVEFDKPEKSEYTGKVSQFFNLLNSDRDVEYNTTTTISEGREISGSKSSKITTSATTTVGTELGGEAKGEGEYGGIKIGLTLSGKVSNTVENKIENEVGREFGFTISNQNTFTQDFKAIGSAGQITVYTYIWERKYVTGRVLLAQDVFPFEATKSYLPSFERANYASIAELPSELLEQYNKLHSADPSNSMDIQNKYAQVNAERLSNRIPQVGEPDNAEQTCPDGVGRYKHYKTGESIYWQPVTGAHLIYGLIKAKWAMLGWERSPLGYPTTDESDTGTGPGRYNNFQDGCIIWKSGSNEAFAVYGNAYQVWGHQNYDAGNLGFPTSDRYLFNKQWRQNFSNQNIIDIVV